jgi:hypothetical protein
MGSGARLTGAVATWTWTCACGSASASASASASVRKGNLKVVRETAMVVVGLQIVVVGGKKRGKEAGGCWVSCSERGGLWRPGPCWAEIGLGE